MCGEPSPADDAHGGPVLTCTAMILAADTGVPRPFTIYPLMIARGVAPVAQKATDNISPAANPHLRFSHSFDIQTSDDRLTIASVDAERDSGARSPVTKIYLVLLSSNL